ncbi:filaggrin-2 [Hyalella azteca]|uniref:Filaggrin-2 n=1 Tax=Hyalella azteca TaxID=294128 RepID=A0A8B7P839_HYAAZ|nr:filaggrin-2 [Hyalella azteca]
MMTFSYKAVPLFFFFTSFSSITVSIPSHSRHLQISRESDTKNFQNLLPISNEEPAGSILISERNKPGLINGDRGQAEKVEKISDDETRSKRDTRSSQKSDSSEDDSNKKKRSISDDLESWDESIGTDFGAKNLERTQIQNFHLRNTRSLKDDDYISQVSKSSAPWMASFVEDITSRTRRDIHNNRDSKLSTNYFRDSQVNRRAQRSAPEDHGGSGRRDSETQEDSEFNQRNLKKRSVVVASRILRQQQKQQRELQKMRPDASQQVSSYTAYELKPAATKHEGSEGKGHKSAGHKAGFVASSGHKSGEGHKAGKGFDENHKGSHASKGASGHSGSGGKKYSGGDHKSSSHGHSSSAAKGAKGHSRGHKAHHSKGAHADGFKAEKNKQESGGKKSFYDDSDHKGYHSKYDHYDSYHESTAGGTEEKGSHASLKKHDAHGEKGHHESADKSEHKADHADKHAHKDKAAHTETSEKTASNDAKHVSKH